MRFGLDVAQQRMPWDELVDRVQFAEDLGFDGAWGFDHFEPMYGSRAGRDLRGHDDPRRAGGQTSRIRLGLLVTGVTYRHPSILAAQAVTVDHASHGRLELALGAAWFDKEHNELGIPFPPTSERFDLLEDALEIMTRLFTGDVVSYEGTGRVAARRADAAGAGAAAASADLDRRQRSAANPPAGRSLRRRLALVGNTEFAAGDQPDARRAGERSGSQIRRRSCGRARSRSTTSTPRASTRRKWRDAGYGYLVCGWPDAGRAQVEQFAREVLPEFTDVSLPSRLTRRSGQG